MWHLWLSAALGVEPYGIEVCADRACAVERIDAMWASLQAQPREAAALSLPTHTTPPKPLSADEQQLIDACDTALARFPGDAAAFDWLSRAGELLYRRDRFTEARPRLQRAIELPPTEQTERAAMLLLDIENILGDLAALEQTARALRERSIGSAEFRKDVAKIEQHAAFKRIESIDLSDRGAQTDAYLAFASRFPDSELASLALSNAAVFLEGAGRKEEAFHTRMYLLSHAETDDPQRAILNRLWLARLCEQLGRRAEAAAHYEQLYPILEKQRVGPLADEHQARDALFNAALLRDQLGEYDAAIRLYRRYRDSYPTDPTLPSIEHRINELNALVHGK